MQLRARVVLEYNVFAGNKGALFGYGELQGPNTFVLIGNWFESNSAPYSTTPLILLSGTKARLENNTFIDNNGGTGIVTVGRGKVQVKNCYFRGNASFFSFSVSCYYHSRLGTALFLVIREILGLELW
jgi:hypothetical protein